MDSFSLDKSLKTGKEATFINVNSLFSFPAPFITRVLFKTPITSYQVIYISLVTGLLSGYLLALNDYRINVFGIVLLLLKNVLDKVDGMLARARDKADRYGRFLDSISDFFVNIAVYSGLTYHLYTNRADELWIGFAALVSTFIQCTFFIYYQVSYIDRVKPLGLNRIDESIRESDRIDTEMGRRTLFLQKLYLMIYGWQDRLVQIFDILSFNHFQKQYPDADAKRFWYMDKTFLTLASSLGLGVQIGIISLFTLIGEIRAGLLYFATFANIWMLFLFLMHPFLAKRQAKGTI